MTFTEIISLTKDFVISGAAITGAIVAIKGLSTWKRQLRGHDEYELSRRILVTIFKYRDSLNRVRAPAMWEYEMPSPTDEEKKAMSVDKIRFFRVSKAYEARWDRVQTERQTLYPDLLHAEAIWGEEIGKLFGNVYKLEQELFFRIQNYLELINPDVDDDSKRAIKARNKKSRDIMYEYPSDEPDEYKKDLISAIKEIERYIKPKMSHGAV